MATPSLREPLTKYCTTTEKWHAEHSEPRQKRQSLSCLSAFLNEGTSPSPPAAQFGFLPPAVLCQKRAICCSCARWNCMSSLGAQAPLLRRQFTARFTHEQDKLNCHSTTAWYPRLDRAAFRMIRLATRSLLPARALDPTEKASSPISQVVLPVNLRRR